MVIIVEGDILLISFTAFAIQTLNGGLLKQLVGHSGD